MPLRIEALSQLADIHPDLRSCSMELQRIKLQRPLGKLGVLAISQPLRLEVTRQFPVPEMADVEGG